MKLYDSLPDSVIVNGKNVRVNLDFRNVLKMMDILSDESLTIEAKQYLAGKCVCRHPRPGVVDAVKRLIMPEQPVEWHQRITDFEQDAEMIIAAFRQVYNIDLLKDKLHWLEFSALLTNLPSGSKYTEVLNIRSKPMPAANQYNTDERQWLAKAKLQYAIRYTEAEEKEMYRQSLKGLGLGFSAMSGGDGN